MIKQPLSLVVTLITLSLVCHAEARTWKSASGNYTIEADLVAFTEEKVILQREDKQLASVEIKQLSNADQTYLASDEARIKTEELHNGKQTWTTKGGVTIIGKVVNFVSKDVTITRRRGNLYVNDRKFSNLPRVYQLIVPKIVGHYENNLVDDEKKLESWLIRQEGGPLVSYKVDGVKLEFENGDMYGIPFFLLKDEDARILKATWDEWTDKDTSYGERSSIAGELRSLAAARQQDAAVDRQIAQLQLGMQAVDAGVTSLWEVTLYPAAGNYGSPLWVVVPGRDSRVATNNALSRNPGYLAGPVRRVSR